MGDYVIFTDSACDLKQDMLNSWGVGYCQLSFAFDSDKVTHTAYEMEAGDFYARMRAGDTAKTAAANPEAFNEAFEQVLRQGKDILHLGFSSGLSTTCQSARIAAEELAEQYPERTIEVVDTLCASAGQGLLVYFAVQYKNQGYTLQQNAAACKDMVPRLCHWFTVDDLVYLKRGGRISPATALVGNMLGIKPVLRVDEEGKLVSMDKARGRKKAIDALCAKYGQLAVNKKGVAFISHGDCLQDAQQLAQLLKKQYGARVEVITDVGPVIGAHAGPGVLALFFEGSARK